MNKKSILFYITFGLLMIGLGCSDALRGVFAPIFQEHFQLNAAGVSMIVTVSYVGNLAFMLFGSRLADSFGVRRVFIAATLAWILAMTVYVMTDSYPALICAIFFSMGASTLLNTLMNIMSPVLFLAPGTVINTLFFVQGIGTTFTQGGIGSMASSFSHWKLVNAVLIVMGLTAVAMFFFLSKDMEGLGKPETEAAADKKGDGVSYGEILSKPAFWLFVLTFGLYFIAEHGIMNWMNIYCQDWLGMASAKAALMPSLFFIGVMVGRLVFAPLVSKFGILKMLLYCMIIGSVIYCIVFIFGGLALYLLLLSGLGFSIVYPTLTMCIQMFFRKEVTTTASGTIIAVATVFDIIFNAVFGTIIDAIGYGIAMWILPVSAVLSLVLYVVMIRTVKPIREI